jgi:hypothetical protein
MNNIGCDSVLAIEPILMSDSSLTLLVFCLLLHLLPEPHSLLTHGLLTFLPLPLLVHGSTLHDALHNLLRIDMLKIMVEYFVESTHLFGCNIGIVGQRHERGRPMVHGIWNAIWKMRQVGFRGSERGRKDDTMDILDGLVSSGSMDKGRK